MSKITKIAVTGGPCAGKTTIMAAIKDLFGDDVAIMEEVATQVIKPREQGGVGIPGVDVEYSREWQDELQRRITEGQISAETEGVQLAEKRDRPTVILCDRGVLDGSAYVEGGREAFLKQFNLNLQTCLGLYDQIIHLESVAVNNPELYEKLKATNPSRFEDAAAAKELDAKMYDAYEGHPNHLVVSSGEGLEKSIELVSSEIRRHMELLREGEPTNEELAAGQNRTV